MPKQTTDIAGVAVGIDYGGAATWTIAKGVSIDAMDTAVASSHARSKLINKGDLSGGVLGVHFDATPGGFVIDNRGSIEGGAFGIFVVGETGGATKIVNAKGAEIAGEEVAIGVVGALRLKNDGRIDGDVIAETASASTVVNKGKIAGGVFLGTGDDVFRSKGKGKAELVDLGRGNDKMVFGAKADTFQFSADLDAETNVDRLKKFESGKDELHLTSYVFGALEPGALPASSFRKGKEAKDADDHIIYNKKTGALYYDPDGAGGANQVKFAQLDKGAKLKASDFTIVEHDFVL